MSIGLRCTLLVLMMFVLCWSDAAVGYCDSNFIDEAPRTGPLLPISNGPVDIPAQEWPLRPGPRTIRILIHYPQGELKSVNARTGIILTLHNWGGVDCVGTASPEILASRYNLIAICVNYLQSGPKDSIEGPEPYDFGYLQALDALRALWYVRDQLRHNNIEWHDGRLFCTGGSGGGNVSLMANKLAPRTFAAVIDLCGMKKLSDDIAFNLEGGSSLNARYTQAGPHPNFLSLADQEIRFPGNPQHLALMKKLGSSGLTISVHGVDDDVCPFADALEFVTNVRNAGLNLEEHWVDAADIDGTVFTSTGHALGNRTEIVCQIAGKYLDPNSDHAITRSTPTDFELGEELTFECTGGSFLVSYKSGFPISRFVPSLDPPDYRDHHQLLTVMNADGNSAPVNSPEDWSVRRSHVIRHFQRVAGQLPGPTQRVPLRPVILEERIVNRTAEGSGEEPVTSVCLQKVSFQSGETWRVSAWLLFPASLRDQQQFQRPAILCLQQTTQSGKDEPAGLAGDTNLHYGLELAQRGFVTLCPDYPTFGDYDIDLSQPSRFKSGTMRAVWDNVRAIDFLESLPIVDQSQIGCIGHSLGGHNAIFTGIFDARIKVMAVICGFTSLSEDDLPSWTGPRYMPAIASEYQNRIELLPFDFHELVASLAPRPVFVFAAELDDDFAVSGVRDVIKSARQIYDLYGSADSLTAHYEPVPHSFPPSARDAAYRFLEAHLSSP